MDSDSEDECLISENLRKLKNQQSSKCSLSLFSQSQSHYFSQSQTGELKKEERAKKRLSLKKKNKEDLAESPIPRHVHSHRITTGMGQQQESVTVNIFSSSSEIEDGSEEMKDFDCSVASSEQPLMFALSNSTLKQGACGTSARKKVSSPGKNSSDEDIVIVESSDEDMNSDDGVREDRLGKTVNKSLAEAPVTDPSLKQASVNVSGSKHTTVANTRESSGRSFMSNQKTSRVLGRYPGASTSNNSIKTMWQTELMDSDSDDDDDVEYEGSGATPTKFHITSPSAEPVSTRYPATASCQISNTIRPLDESDEDVTLPQLNLSLKRKHQAEPLQTPLEVDGSPLRMSPYKKKNTRSQNFHILHEDDDSYADIESAGSELEEENRHHTREKKSVSSRNILSDLKRSSKEQSFKRQSCNESENRTETQSELTQQIDEDTQPYDSENETQPYDCYPDKAAFRMSLQDTEPIDKVKSKEMNRLYLGHNFEVPEIPGLQTDSSKCGPSETDSTQEPLSRSVLKNCLSLLNRQCSDKSESPPLLSRVSSSTSALDNKSLGSPPLLRRISSIVPDSCTSTDDCNNFPALSRVELEKLKTDGQEQAASITVNSSEIGPVISLAEVPVITTVVSLYVPESLLKKGDGKTHDSKVAETKEIECSKGMSAHLPGKNKAGDHPFSSGTTPKTCNILDDVGSDGSECLFDDIPVCSANDGNGHNLIQGTKSEVFSEVFEVDNKAIYKESSYKMDKKLPNSVDQFQKVEPGSVQMDLQGSNFFSETTSDHKITPAESRSYCVTVDGDVRTSDSLSQVKKEETPDSAVEDIDTRTAGNQSYPRETGCYTLEEDFVTVFDSDEERMFSSFTQVEVQPMASANCEEDIWSDDISDKELLEVEADIDDKDDKEDKSLDVIDDEDTSSYNLDSDFVKAMDSADDEELLEASDHFDNEQGQTEKKLALYSESTFIDQAVDEEQPSDDDVYLLDTQIDDDVADDGRDLNTATVDEINQVLPRDSTTKEKSNKLEVESENSAPEDNFDDDMDCALYEAATQMDDLETFCRFSPSRTESGPEGGLRSSPCISKDLPAECYKDFHTHTPSASKMSPAGCKTRIKDKQLDKNENDTYRNISEECEENILDGSDAFNAQTLADAVEEDAYYIATQKDLDPYMAQTQIDPMIQVSDSDSAICFEEMMKTPQETSKPDNSEDEKNALVSEGVCGVTRKGGNISLDFVSDKSSVAPARSVLPARNQTVDLTFSSKTYELARQTMLKLKTKNMKAGAIEIQPQPERRKGGGLQQKVFLSKDVPNPSKKPVVKEGTSITSSCKESTEQQQPGIIIPSGTTWLKKKPSVIVPMFRRSKVTAPKPIQKRKHAQEAAPELSLASKKARLDMLARQMKAITNPKSVGSNQHQEGPSFPVEDMNTDVELPSTQEVFEKGLPIMTAIMPVSKKRLLGRQEKQESVTTSKDLIVEKPDVASGNLEIDLQLKAKAKDQAVSSTDKDSQARRVDSSSLKTSSKLEATSVSTANKNITATESSICGKTLKSMPSREQDRNIFDKIALASVSSDRNIEDGRAAGFTHKNTESDSGMKVQDERSELTSVEPHGSQSQRERRHSESSKSASDRTKCNRSERKDSDKDHDRSERKDSDKDHDRTKCGRSERKDSDKDHDRTKIGRSERKYSDKDHDRKKCDRSERKYSDEDHDRTKCGRSERKDSDKDHGRTKCGRSERKDSDKDHGRTKCDRSERKDSDKDHGRTKCDRSERKDSDKDHDRKKCDRRERKDSDKDHDRTKCDRRKRKYSDKDHDRTKCGRSERKDSDEDHDRKKCDRSERKDSDKDHDRKKCDRSERKDSDKDHDKKKCDRSERKDGDKDHDRKNCDRSERKDSDKDHDRKKCDRSERKDSDKDHDRKKCDRSERKDSDKDHDRKKCHRSERKDSDKDHDRQTDSDRHKNHVKSSKGKASQGERVSCDDKLSVGKEECENIVDMTKQKGDKTKRDCEKGQLSDDQRQTVKDCEVEIRRKKSPPASSEKTSYETGAPDSFISSKSKGNKAEKPVSSDFDNDRSTVEIKNQNPQLGSNSDQEKIQQSPKTTPESDAQSPSPATSTNFSQAVSMIASAPLSKTDTAAPKQAGRDYKQTESLVAESLQPQSHTSRPAGSGDLHHKTKTVRFAEDVVSYPSRMLHQTNPPTQQKQPFFQRNPLEKRMAPLQELLMQKQQHQPPAHPGGVIEPSTNAVQGSGLLAADDLVSHLVQWSPLWFHEYEKALERKCENKSDISLPPLMDFKKLYPLVTAYGKRIDEYQGIFFKLLLLETWEDLYKCWKDEKKKIPHCHVVLTAATSSKTTVLPLRWTGLLTESQQMNKNSPTEGDVVILEMMGRNLSVSPHCDKKEAVLAYVEKSSTSRCQDVKQFLSSNPQLEYHPAVKSGERNLYILTISLKIRYRKFVPSPQQLATIRHVGTLVSAIRRFVALERLPRSLLYHDILNPSQAASDVLFKTPPALLQDPLRGRALLNQEQRLAVQTMLDAASQPPHKPKICLLQGPPGTGKSHVIVALIMKILEKNKNAKVCLAAPSNAAADELLRRLVKFKTDRNMTFSVVRIGKMDNTHHDVKKHTLENKVRAAVNTALERKRMLSVPLSVQDEHKRLCKKLTRLEADLSQLKKENKTREIVNLQRELMRYQRQKQVIDKQINSQPHLDPAEHAGFYERELKQANIVCGTLSSFGQSRISKILCHNPKDNRMSNNHFTCTIIDEATQATELDSLIPLQYNVTKLFLVGDPNQLPPTVLSAKAQSLNYGLSLFERLYNYYQDNEAHNPVMMLCNQYRMDPAICQFPNNCVYDGKLTTDPIVMENCRKFPLNPYILFDIEEGQELQSQSGTVSNDMEASCTAILCEQLIKYNKEIIPRNIGIICPYSGQKRLVNQKLQERKITGIDVNTVDGFQGREKQIIILSCVRARSSSGSIGFLADKRRMNVALTRAKYALYIIAHLDSLRTDHDWQSLILDGEGSDRRVTRKVRSVEEFPKIIRQCCYKEYQARPVQSAVGTKPDEKGSSVRPHHSAGEGKVDHRSTAEAKAGHSTAEPKSGPSAGKS